MSVVELLKNKTVTENIANNSKDMLEFKNDYNNVESLNIYLKCTIDEFLLDKKMHSVDTYRNYLCDINKFAKDLFGYDNYKYLTKENVESVTVDKMIKYRNEQYTEVNEFGERKYANATINRRFSCYKKLYEYLEVRGVIKYDEVNKLKDLLKNLPNHSNEIDVLSMEDAERIMEYFKTKKNGHIVYLMSKLSVDTGLRSRELLTLQWNQFYPIKDKVIIKSKGKIKGKGNKDWEKEISIEFYNEILTLKSEGKDKVFNISYSFIAKLMSEAVEELGLNDKDYTFHSFRKRAATNHYELTNDIMSTKEFLNHSNLNTTQKYVDTKNYGMTGIYSLGDKLDKELYKKVDRELLLEAIGELDKSLIHLLNIKLDEKVKNK